MKKEAVFYEKGRGDEALALLHGSGFHNEKQFMREVENRLSELRMNCKPVFYVIYERW